MNNNQTSGKMIRVAVIGCGQISDAHLNEIKWIKNAETVGVCDLYESLARDTAERFEIKNWFRDFREMITETQPDVVHVTTPANTHLAIGREVLKSGCHAYIEKPFGINAIEAEELIATAQANNKMVCAGFSQWFDLASIRFREILEKGKLGEIVHLESYYGNSMDGNFTRVFLQNKDHWLHKMPGKMIQNVISHALYHIVPIFPGPVEEISCVTLDRSKNGVFTDEIRVMMRSGSTTGYLTVTSSVKPVTQMVRVYGTQGIMEMDLANHLLWTTESTRLPGPIARVKKAIGTGGRLMKEGLRNISLMTTGKDRFFAGLGGLFEKMYDQIRKGGNEPPIPYPVIRGVSKIIDQINEECGAHERGRKVL